MRLPARLPAALAAVGALALAAGPALAQDVLRPSAGLAAGPLLSTIVYGAVGIALCVAGYFAFDKIAGLSLRKELVEDQNVAVGVMLAGVFIGIAIVVAAVMVS